MDETKNSPVNSIVLGLRIFAALLWMALALEALTLVPPVRRMIAESTASLIADRRVSEAQLREGR